MSLCPLIQRAAPSLSHSYDSAQPRPLTQYSVVFEWCDIVLKICQKSFAAFCSDILRFVIALFVVDCL
jgi:hypothetical protein